MLDAIGGVVGTILGIAFSVGFWAFASFVSHAASKGKDRMATELLWGFVVIYAVILWLTYMAFGSPSID